MADERYEVRLRGLASAVDWPPEPDLVPGLRARLAAPPTAVPWWAGRGVRLAIAAAILIALGIAITPASREVVAGWLGLRHVVIERVRVLPTPVPSLSADNPVTLAEARRMVPFTVYAPVEKADAIYVIPGPPGGEVEFHLHGGTLVTEAGGRFEVSIVFKGVGPGTTVDATRVNGHPGAWIHGAPHTVGYFDSAGAFRVETLRLAGDVLVWEESGVVIRVEGAKSLLDALHIAGELH